MKPNDYTSENYCEHRIENTLENAAGESYLVIIDFETLGNKLVGFVVIEGIEHLNSDDVHDLAQGCLSDGVDVVCDVEKILSKSF